jgi:hypothetical protein
MRRRRWMRLRSRKTSAGPRAGGAEPLERGKAPVRPVRLQEREEQPPSLTGWLTTELVEEGGGVEDAVEPQQRSGDLAAVLALEQPPQPLDVEPLVAARPQGFDRARVDDAAIEQALRHAVHEVGPLQGAVVERLGPGLHELVEAIPGLPRVGSQ